MKSANIQAPKTFTLQTDSPHRLQVAEFGNPEGQPLLFLHGGPGSACNPAAAPLFDPKSIRLIQIDQRGCGGSTPAGELHLNTTADLIADLERLRSLLQLPRWAVYGGSWGATLAIEYAKQHRERIDWLLLRGSFLARQQDLDWFTQAYGVAQQRPEAYAALLQALQCTPDKLLPTLLLRLSEPASDEARAYAAALAWDRWEAAVMGLPPGSTENDTAARQRRIARKRIYAHYCVNQFFLGARGVLPEIEKLATLPVFLVHGIDDTVCPISAAQTLQQHLPQAQLLAVEGGHDLFEKGIRDGIASALAQLLG